MNVRSGRRTGAVVAALVLLSVLAAIPAAPVASALTAFVTPRYIRTIGGDGRPGVFSWGSYSFAPPAGGSYGLQVRSIDTSGNIGTPATWRNFTAT